jgi:hypothetical protein
MKINLQILALLIALVCPAFAYADPVRMSVQPNGKGSFVLEGENVVGVQDLDIEVEYDSNLLENPYVLINGGDVTQLSSDAPGRLLISIFRPVPDPILQVIINFDAKTDKAGGINHISASARSMTKWPSEPDNDLPSSSVGDDAGPAEGPAAGSSKTGAGGTVLADLVQRLQSEVVPDRNKGTDRISALPGAVSLAGANNRVSTEETVVLIHEEKNVLERFKYFKGKKGLGSFAALFGRRGGDRYIQEPPIAISDGKTPVTVKMEVQPEGSRSAGIALADATLISKEANGKGIVITVLPSEGTWDARLVIVEGDDILGYPLVVAPPVNLAGGINANNFLDALQTFISNQPPTFQWEDNIYISEYIFTANYLADMLKKARLSVPQH